MPYTQDQLREYYKTRKKEFIQMLGSKCQICGYNKCIEALDFHHKDLNNDVYNHAYCRKSFKKEIEDGKIVLLCANCHRELHAIINKAKRELNYVNAKSI